MRSRRWLWLGGLLVASACSPTLHKQIDLAEKDFQNHIGFTLFDPEKGKTIFDHHGDRYFIPASNTKIFTLFTSLRLLGDSIPGLRYEKRGDSLVFWGTGDPSFLYEHVVGSARILDFLRSQPSRLYFSSANFHTDHFGPGWSWGDYRYAYQVERTPFPVYGNRFHMHKEAQAFIATPRVFNAEVLRAPAPKENHEMVRNISSNALLYVPGQKDTVSDWEIPFHYTDELFARLLADTLKKDVNLVAALPTVASKFLYSVPSDSLYKVMMQESDNFIAEQLLLLCGGLLSDTLSTEIAIREVKKQFLADLPDVPNWVDGSGLSRMNLFTPRSIVSMWEKIARIVPRDRLFGLVAVGGLNGTIKDYYKAERPYIYGKTGSLRNNHMLSGFLVTRSGRMLIFSWMNNNFTTRTTDVRNRMQDILKNIYETY